MLVGIPFTTKDPSALPIPNAVPPKPLIVNGSPGLKSCGAVVVTVIKLEPIPYVAIDASVTTDITFNSVPGTS